MIEEVCGVRAVSSDEETEVQSDDEGGGANDVRKQNVDRKLTAVETKIATLELKLTANECMRGGYPEVLLKVRKPKMSEQTNALLDTIIQTANTDGKFLRTLEKLIPVRLLRDDYLRAALTLHHIRSRVVRRAVRRC